MATYYRCDKTTLLEPCASGEVESDDAVMLENRPQCDVPDHLSSPLQADVLLPVQLLSIRGRPLTGERRLMFAILEDAFWCFQKNCAAQDLRRRRIFREAEEWLFLNDWHWPFSFDRICDALDLHAGYLRRGLRRWQQDEGESVVAAAFRQDFTEAAHPPINPSLRPRYRGQG